MSFPLSSSTLDGINDPVACKKDSNLAMLSIYIIALGFLLDVYGCWILNHVFDVDISPIVPLEKSSNFSDFWLWFEFPNKNNVPDTFYASPPGTILLMKGFWGWVDSIAGRTVSLIIYTISWVSALTYAVFYTINAHNKFDSRKLLWSVLLIMLSYSVYFNMERQNIAGFVIAICMLGVIFYKEEKLLLSILCLATAINIKIIPLVFLTLPFIERRWALLVKYLFAVLLFFLVPFILVQLLFDPDYSLEKLSWGMQSYYDWFVVGNVGGVWESSAFRAVKEIYQLFSLKADYHKDIIDALYAYHISVAIFTVVMVLLLFIKRPPFLYSVILLACWFILAPDAMGNYYLDILLLPLLLSIREGNKLYTILLSIALIPKWFTGIPSINPIVSPLIIFLIILLCMYHIYKLPALKS